MYGDLATLDAVKAYLTIGGKATASSDDAELSSLITSASDFIHQVSYRFFPLADYEEIRDGHGGETLLFGNSPVQAVISLIIDGFNVPASPNRIRFGYTWTPTEITLHGYWFSRRKQNVVITYTAGFAQIPPTASQACIELVATKYRERARLGVASENIVGVRAVTYKIQDMLPITQTALNAIAQTTPIIAYIKRLAPTQTDPGLLASVI